MRGNSIFTVAVHIKDPNQYCGYRTIVLDHGRATVITNAPLPPNVIRNQKYSLLTFLPVVLYEQFKYFFNLYFLIVALSQFVPVLQVGASVFLKTQKITALIIRNH